MYLNERKIRILEAIINDYIASAEPIGSRTIAKKYDLGISSATIRNEMSDLEEMGFIVQPHASAGRVPSDKGYRYYVDSLMHRRELMPEEIEYMKKMIAGNINKIDYLMKEVARALAILTNCITVVTEPHINKTTLKHLQLVPLDESSILLVAVTDSKNVKNNVIRVDCVPDYDTLSKMTIVLNNRLSGLSNDGFDPKVIETLRKDLGSFGHLAPIIVKTVYEIISYEDNLNVYTSGVKNILGFPEFNDIDKARAIFSTLEENEELISLLDSDDDNIKIIIGSENALSHFRDCSIIKANYSFGGQTYGNIGIIGPTRMNYPQIVSVLNGVVQSINSALSANDNKT